VTTVVSRLVFTMSGNVSKIKSMAQTRTDGINSEAKENDDLKQPGVGVGFGGMWRCHTK
jgi:hypothetical protein